MSKGQSKVLAADCTEIQTLPGVFVDVGRLVMAV